MLFDDARQDARYALRTLRKSRGFALTAILTLALGIGGNTAIFSVIRAVLLNPLAFHDPDRLIFISADIRKPEQVDMRFAPDRLAEMRSAAHSFTAIGAFGGNLENVTLSGEGQPVALRAARVSANFLEVLGVPPLLGRSFLPQEDAPRGAPVVMISANLWRRRFQADPHIVGKPATLDARSYTIVGVLPPSFEFPFSGLDAWFPRPSEWSMLPPRYWSLPLLDGFGRLKPHVTLAQARVEMDVLNRQYDHAHPGPQQREVRLDSLQDRLVRNVRPLLWTLFGAVGFVLLIACANVANLLLARATSRSREFAVRAALGAGRGRLVRQLLAESVILALSGGVLGAFLARAALMGVNNANALNLHAPNAPYLPGAGNVHLDLAVLAFTIALSFLTGILFGLFPGLRLSRPDLADNLRESGATAGRGWRTHRARFATGATALLIVTQIALSVVLLIGAALLMRSIVRLHSVQPGFEPANLLTMKIALPPARYTTDEKKAEFFRDLVQRVERLPGVRNAAVSLSLPTTTWIRTNIMYVEGQPPLDENNPLMAVIQSVTPDYFETLHIAFRRGRAFTEQDNRPGAPPAIIVNETLARRLWPNLRKGFTPIGIHISEGYDKKVGLFQLVGTVADVHEGGLAYAASPEFYVPCAIHPPQTAYLVARTEGDPLSFANSIRKQVLAIDPDQSVSDVKLMTAVLESTLGQRNAAMLLLACFAGIALTLAVIGIYGVLAYSVAQRTHEVGVRRALGARERDILGLVVRQGFGLSVIGVAVGLCASVALTRVLRNMLFNVTATDPATFATVAALFLAAALLASYLPARRAARIDPMAALRTE